jgi:hypothetical protein
MMDLLSDLNERTYSSDKCYGVIGRALTYVTSFERNCKTLHCILRIGKEFSLDDQEAIGSMVKSLFKCPLGPHVSYLADTHAVFLQKRGLGQGDANMLSDFFGTKLRVAKAARNEIAHDVTVGIADLVEDDEGRASVVKRVEPCIRDIAWANWMVFNMQQGLTGEPVVRGVDHYCDEAVKWVCEIDDDV